MAAFTTNFAWHIAQPLHLRTPRGEPRFARVFRLMADRSHLAELEPRLLRDVGLVPRKVAPDVQFGQQF